MKRIKICAATLASALILALAGFLLVWGLAGVRAVHANLVIATFAVHGIETEQERQELEGRLAHFHGYYKGAVLRHASSENLWLARVQFNVTGMDEARAEITRWLASVPGTMHAQPVLATFYKFRLERPGRGDLVFGKHRSVLPLN